MCLVATTSPRLGSVWRVEASLKAVVGGKQFTQSSGMLGIAVIVEDVGRETWAAVILAAGSCKRERVDMSERERARMQDT